LWSEPDTRKALLENLSEKGYGDEQLSEIKRMIDAENSDLFDVLAYVAFALSPITRAERVEFGRARIATEYDEKLQMFLDFVLSQYVKEGVGELDQSKLPDLLELRYRAVRDAAKELGGVPKIRDAFIGFQKYLYEGKTRDQSPLK
ncbi:MAG: type I restriction-modification enzyme R subunit C-terminal domain-containing protein, partial [Burkholderiaceae bacterium]